MLIFNRLNIQCDSLFFTISREGGIMSCIPTVDTFCARSLVVTRL